MANRICWWAKAQGQPLPLFSILPSLSMPIFGGNKFVNNIHTKIKQKKMETEYKFLDSDECQSIVVQLYCYFSRYDNSQHKEPYIQIKLSSNIYYKKKYNKPNLKNMSTC